MKICIPLYIIGLFFFACTNNELPNPQEQNPCDNFISLTAFNDTCFEILDPRPPEIVDHSKYGFLHPSYDRVNPNRFLYRQAGGTDVYLVADKCKETYTKVVDGSLAGRIRPQLGYNNWLAYCTTLEELMIKKVEEENALHLLPGVKCAFPKWINENEIICQAEFSDPFALKTLIVNIEGEIVQSFDFPYGKPVAYNDKIATHFGPWGQIKIGFLNALNDYQFSEVFTLPQVHQVPLSIDWLDDEHIVWTDKIGLHKVNIITGAIVTLKENCENRDIMHISASPNRDGTILFGQINYTIEEEELDKDIFIYQFDTNTGEQKRVELEPQF